MAIAKSIIGDDECLFFIVRFPFPASESTVIQMDAPGRPKIFIIRPAIYRGDFEEDFFENRFNGFSWRRMGNR